MHLRLVDIVDGRQYARVHACYGLTETWLVSGEAGSNGTSSFTRRLLGKSRCLWRYKLEIAIGTVFLLYSSIVKK